MSSPRLLGISGSLRQGSSNRLMLAEAARAFGPCDFVTADIDLPLYNQDIEDGPGIPDKVLALGDQIAAADAVVISSPEYNKNIPGALKNALDWLSRTDGAPWKGKPVSLLGCSAGRAGGERMIHNLILCMMPFQPNLVYGPEVFIAGANRAFDENGRLKDEKSFEILGTLMGRLRAAVSE